MATFNPLFGNTLGPAQGPNPYQQMPDLTGLQSALGVGRNMWMNPTGAGMGGNGVPQWGTPPPGAMAGANPPGGMTGMPDSMAQYGYGNRPGQGGGYYEQQTPVGSFAAANQQQAGSTFAVNPYIGQATSQYGQGNTNPYLGQSSGQASASNNPYFGAGNPYTTQAIDAASADAARNYNLYIAPQRDAQMARSGSFGNTGVQQMQLEDQRNFGNTLGNIANSARMQDLFRQQDMGESAANRQTGVSQFNTGVRGADLSRNLLGTFQGQGMGLDALRLDSGLAQQLGMFNAGSANTNSMFNAGQGNQMNMFNVGQGNNMLENYRNRSQNMDQFNQNMDFNVWSANNQNMRNGYLDQMNMLNSLMGLNTLGLNTANAQNNYPLDIWQMLMNGATQAGGQGGTTTGTNTQQLQGNPLLGWIGGMQLGRQLFPG